MWALCVNVCQYAVSSGCWSTTHSRTPAIMREIRFEKGGTDCTFTGSRDVFGA